MRMLVNIPVEVNTERAPGDRFGRVAFEAYSTAMRGDGKREPVIAWDELSADVQSWWTAAAAAVLLRGGL